MHAVLALQMSDQAVVARRGERVASDQKRMEAEHHAQARVAEIVIHLGHDGAVSAEPDEVRHGAQGKGQRVKRLVCELLEGDLEYLLACRHEAVVARNVCRVEAGDLCPHPLLVGAVAEHRTVIEADLVERIAWADIDVVVQVSAAHLPQVLEHVGRGDDGGTGIEGEAVLPVGVGAPSRPVQLVHHGDAVALGSQPCACCKPAYATADDHRVRRTCPAVAACPHQHASPSGIRLCLGSADLPLQRSHASVMIRAA